MSSGVGRRCGLDLVWLWLWCRPVAIALIGPLAWEPPCATDAALKKPKKKQIYHTKPPGPLIILPSLKFLSPPLGISIFSLLVLGFAGQEIISGFRAYLNEFF